MSESSPNCLVSFPLPFVSRREAVGLRRRYEWGKRMKIRVEELGDRRSILGTLVLRSYPSCDRSFLGLLFPSLIPVPSTSATLRFRDGYGRNGGPTEPDRRSGIKDRSYPRHLLPLLLPSSRVIRLRFVSHASRLTSALSARLRPLRGVWNEKRAEMKSEEVRQEAKNRGR